MKANRVCSKSGDFCREREALPDDEESGMTKINAESVSELLRIVCPIVLVVIEKNHGSLAQVFKTGCGPCLLLQ